MLVTTTAFGQPSVRHSRNNLNRMSVDAMDDLGKIKLLAEHGNTMAQLKLAGACMDNRLCADALKWYSAAAENGQLDACYQKGRLLLYGSQNTAPDQCVVTNAVEGLRLIYQTATNHHAGAYYDMGLALKDGNGCAADPVNAYAWFTLSSDSGEQASKRIINEMSLHLSTEEIRQALAEARDMKADRWPDLPPLSSATVQTLAPATVAGLNLKLSGVIQSPNHSLAIINNRTFGKGETAMFVTEQKQQVAVTLQRIHSDSVEVQVEGEANLRKLMVTSSY